MTEKDGLCTFDVLDIVRQHGAHVAVTRQKMGMLTGNPRTTLIELIQNELQFPDLEKNIASRGITFLKSLSS